MRLVILTALMSMTAAAQPAITGIDPPSAPPGEQITISGSGLARTADVRFRHATAPVIVATESCAIVAVPADARSGQVTVVAGGKESNPVRFRVDPRYWSDFEYPDQSSRPPIDFMRFRRPDGTTVAYFAAGDRYLETGFAMLDRYWTHRPEASDMPRGHLKGLLPPTLKRLGHEPSAALMHHFATTFFDRQDRGTGLVPFDLDSWDRYADEERHSELPGYVTLQVTEHFLEWFPDDPQLLARSAALARGIVRTFDGCGGNGSCGIHSAVDAETGRPTNSLTRTGDFGAIGSMVSEVGRRIGDPALGEWARRKQEFVWAHRLNPELPLLPDFFAVGSIVVPPGESATSDTDTLYNVRRLYEMYAATGDRRYLDHALNVSDFWFEHAWNAQWGHFVRKLEPDGSQATDMLYGDSMYNTLWVLIHAYRYTGRQAYLERVKEAWRNLVSMGRGGLPPRHLQRSGLWEDRGLARNQANFIEILLEAYDASGDSDFLCEAERHADTILADPDAALPNPAARASFGGSLLHLAEVRTPIDRLEVHLAGPSRVRVETAAGGTVLDTGADADIAVIYVPRGSYRVRTRLLPPAK